jgi:hypothetical protein
MDKIILNSSKLHAIIEEQKTKPWWVFGNLELLDKNICHNLVNLLWSWQENIKIMIDHSNESVIINWLSVDKNIQTMPLDIEEPIHQKTYRHIISAMQQAMNMWVFNDIFKKDS